MKQILFIALLLSFTIEAVFPFRLSHVLGLSLKNIVSYCAIMVLFLSEVALGGIRRKKIPELPILIIITVGVGVNLIVQQITDHTKLSILEHLILFKKWIIDPLILYVLICLLVDNVKDAERFLLIIVITFAFLNMLSVVGLKFGIQLFKTSSVVEQNVMNRFAGAYKNPNQMAYFLCFLLPFLYYFMMRGSNRFLKAFLALLIFFSIGSVLMSGSRGGILSLGIVVLGIMLLRRDFKLFLLCMVFVIAFIMIIRVVGKSRFIETTSQRVSVLTKGDLKKASNFRFIIWKAYYELIENKPVYIVFGKGFGVTSTTILKRYDLKVPPHNLYLQILVEFGLIGLCIWIYFLYRIIRRVIKARSQEDIISNITLVALSVILFGWCFTSLIYVLKFIVVTGAASLSYINHLYDDVKVNAKEELSVPHSM